jgi:hypothetical protein
VALAVFANGSCFLVHTGEFSLVHTKKRGLGSDLSRQGKISLSGQFGEGFLLLCVGYALFYRLNFWLGFSGWFGLFLRLFLLFMLREK